MHIQQESPRIHNPLATLEEDYAQAVLHLAWEEREGTDERRLLFGMVELLPVEVPPPLDDGEQQTMLEGGPSVRIHLRRVVVSAARGLAWYLDCRRGIGIFPGQDGELLDAEHAEAKFKLADLGEEPPWPSLVCISGESPTVPFCPGWHESPRVHHLIPLSEQGPSRLWLKEQMREHATRWLSDRLHFSFEDYPEYWGSIHLVAPNPVFRHAGRSLLTGSPPKESVLVSVQPRAGKSAQGLQVTLTEKQPWGVLDIRSEKLHHAHVRFDFDHTINGTKVDIIDPHRGVLQADSQSGCFLRGVGITIDLVSTTLRVGGSSPEDSHEVMRTNKDHGISTIVHLASDSKVPLARARMHEAVHKRNQRSQQEEQDQHWFAEGRQEAADALRKRIRNAEQTVFLVDASFHDKDLRAFALAVSQENVPVFVLCAMAPLLQASETPGISRGQALLTQLLDIRSELPSNPIVIRVMLGEPPSIQDVLLGVDKSWWLLGSAFRTFGERGSLLSRIADPSLVQEHVRKVWEDSVELQRWVESIDQKGQKGAWS